MVGGEVPKVYFLDVIRDEPNFLEKAFFVIS